MNNTETHYYSGIQPLNIKKGRRYTDEEKQACLDLFVEGMSLEDIQRQTGICTPTIHRWAIAAGLEQKKKKRRMVRQIVVNKIPPSKNQFQVASINGIRYKIDGDIPSAWGEDGWQETIKNVDVIRGRMRSDLHNGFDVWWDKPRNVLSWTN